MQSLALDPEPPQSLPPPELLVLVAAPSNAGVDELARRLVQVRHSPVCSGWWEGVSSDGPLRRLFPRL